MTDIYPKKTFIYCRESEIDRLAHTLKVIVSGFYHIEQYLILPNLPNPGEPSVVVLPNLPYNSIPDLKAQLDQMETHAIPANPPLSLIKALDFLLPQLPKLEKEFEPDWNEVSAEFFKFLTYLWPKLTPLIASVEIRPTHIGTICSWNRLSKTNPSPFTVYVRSDASIANIAEAILTALVRLSPETAYASFKTTEAIVDYLILETSLQKLFPAYRPTFVSLVRRQQSLVSDSLDYLNSLKLPIANQGLQLKGKHILVNAENINNKLTRTEEKLFKTLLKHHHELVPIDQLMDETWSESCSKNLWAVSKAVDRLRQKLKMLGIPASIKTVRSRGYLLD